jgi:hypothetical protein
MHRQGSAGITLMAGPFLEDHAPNVIGTECRVCAIVVSIKEFGVFRIQRSFRCQSAPLVDAMRWLNLVRGLIVSQHVLS